MQQLHRHVQADHHGYLEQDVLGGGASPVAELVVLERRFEAQPVSSAAGQRENVIGGAAPSIRFTAPGMRSGIVATKRVVMMGNYVQLGPVKTWYDEHGQGDPLVLLHGGLVDARFFEPNLPALAAHFHLYTPERRGHGHTPDVQGPITYQLMTDDTIAFLETVVGQPADLVAHSDGAFVAMLV